jgi:hypothetical protein
MVANSNFNAIIIWNIHFGRMVCFKNISGGNINVWKKTNVERINPLDEILD